MESQHRAVARRIFDAYFKANDGDVQGLCALIAKLCEAIKAWAEVPHAERCDALFRYRGPHYVCTCGAGEVNVARLYARQLAGLEGRPNEGSGKAGT